MPAGTEISATEILKFRPGRTYVASGFWEPVSFTVEADGWWSRGTDRIGGLWVYLEYHEDDESDWDLDVSVIASHPDTPLEDLTSDIVDNDRLEVLADPMPATLAGHDAFVLDVIGLAGAVVGPFDPCTFRGPEGNSRFDQVTGGFVLLGAEANAFLGWKFGVRECRVARIWVVDVDGSTIVIIAAAFNEELFGQLIPAAEGLIAGIEFHR